MKQTDAVLQAWLDRATAVGGPYDPAALFLGVATAVNDMGASTVQADVTEGGGALATRVAVTPWSAAYKMADGRWVKDGPPCSFTPASAAEAATITHWFLNSAAAAGTLKAFGQIGEGVNLPDENHTWTIVPRLTIDPNGRFSAEVTWNG